MIYENPSEEDRESLPLTKPPRNRMGPTIASEEIVKFDYTYSLKNAAQSMLFQNKQINLKIDPMKELIKKKEEIAKKHHKKSRSQLPEDGMLALSSLPNIAVVSNV